MACRQPAQYILSGGRRGAGAGGIKGHFTAELVWAAVVELQPNALGAQLRSGSLGASDSVVTLSLVRQLKSINNKKQNF